MSYDGFGRMASTTTSMGGFSRTVSHQYDRDGGEVETTFPDGAKFWTARDGLGRPTEGWQGALGSTAHIMIAFGYNAAGQRSHFARRFADNSRYAYDPAGRLQTLSHNPDGTDRDHSLGFAYDPAGQIVRRSKPGGRHDRG